MRWRCSDIPSKRITSSLTISGMCFRSSLEFTSHYIWLISNRLQPCTCRCCISKPLYTSSNEPSNNGYYYKKDVVSNPNPPYVNQLPESRKYSHTPSYGKNPYMNDDTGPIYGNQTNNYVAPYTARPNYTNYEPNTNYAATKPTSTNYLQYANFSNTKPSRNHITIAFIV